MAGDDPRWKQKDIVVLPSSPCRAARPPPLIDMWYSAEQRHSTLGYVSPMQDERRLG